MLRTKQEYINLLEETVSYYAEDVSRRSVNKDSEMCSYININGNKCAVGRCLQNYTSRFEYWSVDKRIGENFLISDLDFKERYQNFDRNFWVDLQLLHDKAINWLSNGLSEEGTKFVSLIKKKIEKELYEHI